jgi:hypothetical protein
MMNLRFHKNKKFRNNCIPFKEDYNSKVNVKFSLSLINYHAMMTYPLLNKAPHREDVLGSGDIAPRILNFDT